MGLEINDGPGRKLPRGKGTATSAPVTFSQQIINAANRIEYADWQVGVTNRRVGVRAPKGGDAMRLARILSAEDSAKPQVFNQCMLAFCITEIDSDPVARPGTSLQIEFILDRLGFEGIAAAAEAFARFGQINGEDDPKN